MLKAVMALKGVLKTAVISSSNIAQVTDYYGSDFGGLKEGTAPQYSENFRKTVGMLAEEAGADAGLVIWAEPALATVKPLDTHSRQWGLVHAMDWGLQIAEGDKASPWSRPS